MRLFFRHSKRLKMDKVLLAGLPRELAGEDFLRGPMTSFFFQTAESIASIAKNFNEKACYIYYIIILYL